MPRRRRDNPAGESRTRYIEAGSRRLEKAGKPQGFKHRNGRPFPIKMSAVNDLGVRHRPLAKRHDNDRAKVESPPFPAPCGGDRQETDDVIPPLFPLHRLWHHLTPVIASQPRRRLVCTRTLLGNNWAASLPARRPPANKDKRIAAFFTATGWFYLIATISLELTQAEEPLS